MLRAVSSARRHLPQPEVAVVTGAGGGIGRALARQLARRGTALALVDCDPEALSLASAECERAGGRVSTWKVDVADASAVTELAISVVAEHGGADALFNVAGLIHAGRLTDTDFADIQRVIAVDLLGTIAACKAFLPHLEAARQARIVNVSSAFGLVGVGGYSAYNAAKFAVRGFSEALQQEVGPTVRVSCAFPGGVRTNIMRNGLYSPATDAAGIQQRFDEVIARTSPEATAAAILRGSARGRRRIMVGADARLADALARATGTGYQVLTRRLGVGGS